MAQTNAAVSARPRNRSAKARLFDAFLRITEEEAEIILGAIPSYHANEAKLAAAMPDDLSRMRHAARRAALARLLGWGAP